MDSDLLAINTIRTLAMDAVQKANSGHPGTPMALAPLSHLLWTRFIKFDPQHPRWYDRDRFILSCGHASMLLYAQLHLAGFDVSLEDLKRFRQWESKTPGHPEYGLTPGVETTTGPLGQGFANAVGMAIAEKHLAAKFNRDEFPIVDHFTYALASDGDLMEGISAEAASIAGHLELGKLIVFYDDNEITIDGSTDLTFSEDVGKRFEAYGWHVQRVNDANDLKALEKATLAARAEAQRPSLVIVCSHIAFGSPHKQDSSEAHGAPLGEDEVRLTKEAYDWPTGESFVVPDEVRRLYSDVVRTNAEKHASWQQLVFEAYAHDYSSLAAEFVRIMEGRVPQNWDEDWSTFSLVESLATRQASSRVMQRIAAVFPEFIGGSADLAISNLTQLKKEADFSPPHPAGRNIHYGIREHAMGGISNGLALHGGCLPFAATFLVFSDYMRPAIRLAALMKLPVRYVFTHDSIGLGEDGPTHQPIEHLMSLRMIPELTVIRPADAIETLGAWKHAVSERFGPMALSLTRQKLPTLSCTREEGVQRGAYVLMESKQGSPQIILIATGSEVAPSLEAWKLLEQAGIAARLVSMPSWELFAKQSAAYQAEVFPPAVATRLSIEAGTTFGWERYVGAEGDSIGIDHFGASAPAEVLFQKFGFTPQHIFERAKQLLKKS